MELTESTQNALLAIIGILAAAIVAFLIFRLERHPHQWTVEHLENNSYKIARYGFRKAQLRSIHMDCDGAPNWTNASGEVSLVPLKRGQEFSFNYDHLDFSVRGREVTITFTIGNSTPRHQVVIL